LRVLQLSGDRGSDQSRFLCNVEHSFSLIHPSYSGLILTDNPDLNLGLMGRDRC
jgi:hypothetical protein